MSMNGQPATSRPLAFATAVAITLPWLSAITLATGAVYAWALLGRWPVVYQDSVSGPCMDLSIHASFLAIASLVPSLFVGSFVVLWLGRNRGALSMRRRAVAFFTGWLLLAILVWLDPVGYTAWVVD